MIELKIDYAQFSFDARVAMPLESFVDFKGRSNIKFYKAMTRYQSGLLVYEGNPNSSKKLAVMTGKVCDVFTVNADFIKLSRQWDAKYSRLDLAMTTDEDILTRIKNDHEKVVSEKFPTGKQIANFEDKPETLIFGDMSKRSKRGMVRCYDKALQSGLEGVILHRVEIENRKNDAHIASKRLESGDSMQSVMNSRWRVDSSWYKRLMSDDIAITRFKTDDKPEISEINRKMAWIMNQVVPTLKYIREYDEDNGTKNFDLILDELGLTLG